MRRLFKYNFFAIANPLSLFCLTSIRTLSVGLVAAEDEVQGRAGKSVADFRTKSAGSSREEWKSLKISLSTPAQGLTA